MPDMPEMTSRAQGSYFVMNVMWRVGTEKQKVGFVIQLVFLCIRDLEGYCGVA